MSNRTRVLTNVSFCTLLAISCAAGEPGPVATLPVVAPPLIERLIEYDAALMDESERAAARTAFAGYLDSAAACGADTGGGRQCLLDKLLGPGELESVQSAVDARASTVTHALDQGAGSCAALVAVVLAVADENGTPMEAAILRDHVVLADLARDGTYYEVLEGGRRLRHADLDRLAQQPGDLVEVDAAGYVPYYLDNLAARLAESGEIERADGFFRASLEQAPDAARIHYNYGTFLVRNRRHAEAVAHLNRAIDLGWDDADAWVNRGVALWRADRVEEARKSFETALGIDPTNKEATRNLRKIGAAVTPGERP